MLEALKKAVLEANQQLVKNGLAVLTWGNVSALDRESGLVVIKPSGVPYTAMRVSDMVVVDLKGNIAEGDLRPSSDTPTHLCLYKNFPQIGAVVHTHSPAATCFAQAEQGIVCMGTTHADYFYGEIPCTRGLTAEETASNYEENTGMVIVGTFRERGLDPQATPGVLVSKHGPFVWGETADKAVEHAIVLEYVAAMTAHTIAVRPDTPAAPGHLMDKHYFRKHGRTAYYGQG